MKKPTAARIAILREEHPELVPILEALARGEHIELQPYQYVVRAGGQSRMVHAIDLERFVD